MKEDKIVVFLVFFRKVIYTRGVFFGGVEMAQVPAMIGKYKVESFIAQGGMGAVYRAIHPGLKRPVIIKKMLARGNKIEAARFEQEAKILLDLQCPYIVHLHDYFTEGSYRYMVEELVDGMACDKLLKKQEYLSPEAAATIIRDVAKALQFAHNKGVVHRDIKGGNVLISKNCVIKLADFGIASEKGTPSPEEKTQVEGLTMAGASLGTPNYMAPEQIEDSSTVDHRCDIYSLGVMFYELVTGQKPYGAAISLSQLKQMARKGKFTAPEKINPDVPPIISKLIKKMMAPKPSARPANATAILATLDKYLKDYDEHEIKVEIARMVSTDKKYTENKYKKKSKIAQKIAIIAGCTLLMAGAFFFAWKAGAIHRYILFLWYSPVTAEILDSKGNRESESHKALSSASVEYFFDTEGLPEAAKSTIGREVFLKRGDYRVKVALGSLVWWRSFSVGRDACHIECKMADISTRPIRVVVRVFDRESGKEITNLAGVDVNFNGLWKPLAAVPRDKIRSGQVWKFRVNSKGYNSEDYSLKIDSLQDEVHIDSALSKKK